MPIAPCFDRSPAKRCHRLMWRYAALLLGLCLCVPIPAASPHAAAATLRVCPAGNTAPDCDFDSIAAALNAASDGDTIAIRAGIYQEAAVVRASSLTIRAEPGAHMRGKAAEGKAALVIKGDDTLIEGLECSNVRIGDNGACIRFEGRNLTLRRVFFHHSEMGILSGIGRGDVIIEDSRFEDMQGAANTLGHAIYIGEARSLELRRSQVLRTAGLGHSVKSRTQRTVVEGSVIASLDAPQSRAIDAAFGGETIVRGNIIQQGASADNDDLIGIGLEQGSTADWLHRTLIEGNMVICDRPRCILVRAHSSGNVTLRDNRLVGPIEPATADSRAATSQNAAFDTRRDGGLPPYPGLPAPPN